LASSNNLILVFPQQSNIVTDTVDEACFDLTGWTGTNFETNAGSHPTTMKAMWDRVFEAQSSTYNYTADGIVSVGWSGDDEGWSLFDLWGKEDLGSLQLVASMAVSVAAFSMTI